MRASTGPRASSGTTDELTLQFVENSLYLMTLGPRHAEFDVLADTRIDRDGAKALADATEGCWQAILDHDIARFGQHFRESFEAQIAMFPNMMNKTVANLIDQYQGRSPGLEAVWGRRRRLSDPRLRQADRGAVRVIARRESD